MTKLDEPCLLYQRRCIVPDDARPGMHLHRDVRLPDGRVLLPAGSVLDADMIARLQQRGIEYLHVAVPDPRSPAEVAAEAAALARRVEFIFRGESTAARLSLQQIVQGYRQKENQPCPLAG